MNPAALGVNLLWWASCLPGAARHRAALRHVEATQRRLLASILRSAAATACGRAHGFAGIRSAEEYRERVPLARYEDLLPWIEEAAAGTPDVLSPGRPLGFEPTSGSASAGKLIPWTAGLRREFQAAVAPWVSGMFSADPALAAGRAYWAVSPVSFERRRTAGGIPVGFDADTAYLGPAVGRLLERALAVPPQAALVADIAAFRYVTLAFLLRAADLSLISVWNPTFLTLLLERLEEWRAPLVRDLGRGRLSPPAPVPADLLAGLSRRLGAHPRRAAEVDAILARGDAASACEELWPRLRLISCWADGPAARCVETLRSRFPRVRIAPKGLVATEGIVSLPLPGVAGGALAVTSHFLEFLPDGGGRARCAWELERGAAYSVVLTTSGGLYRYRLDDVVRVTGFAGECPVIAFVGRGGKVSDLYGEKLHEAHVSEVLEAAFAGLPRPAFAMLAPDGGGAPGAPGAPDRYTLFLAGGEPPPAGDLDRVRERCESGLLRNPHYAYCRRLGQLKGLEVCRLPGDPRRALGTYQDRCLRRGQRDGAVKPAALDAATDWRRTFEEAAP